MAKNLKKAASLFLAILMVLSVGVSAFTKDVSAFSWSNSNTITESPADLVVTEGDEAVFTVKANGETKVYTSGTYNMEIGQ